MEYRKYVYHIGIRRTHNLRLGTDTDLSHTLTNLVNRCDVVEQYRINLAAGEKVLQSQLQLFIYSFRQS